MRPAHSIRLPLFTDAGGRFSFEILRFAWQLERQSRRSVQAQFCEQSPRLQAVRIAPPVAKPVRRR
jgi:hypothetical protein